MRKSDEVFKSFIEQFRPFFYPPFGNRVFLLREGYAHLSDEKNELSRIRVITDGVNLKSVLIQEASVMEGNITDLN